MGVESSRLSHSPARWNSERSHECGLTKVVKSMTKQIETAMIKRMVKATSAQVGVPVNTSLAESEMKRVIVAHPESVKSACLSSQALLHIEVRCSWDSRYN